MKTVRARMNRIADALPNSRTKFDDLIIKIAQISYPRKLVSFCRQRITSTNCLVLDFFVMSSISHESSIEDLFNFRPIGNWCYGTEHK